MKTRKTKREEHNKSTIKPDPEKYCAYCGKEMHRVRFESVRLEDLSAFSRRKYCNRECMRKAFVKVGQSKQTYRCAHLSAYRLAYEILGKEKRCEICGSKRNIDVHHKDKNYRNNTAENIMIVCRSCHMKLHRNKDYGKDLSN